MLCPKAAVFWDVGLFKSNKAGRSGKVFFRNRQPLSERESIIKTTLEIYGGESVTVYVDEVFLVNLLMDGLLLWATGRLGHLAYTRRNLFLGALCGALYAILILLPFGQYLAGILGKVACSVLMVEVAFHPKNFKALGKALAYCYTIAFAMGGAVIAAMYFFGERFIQTLNGIAMVLVDFKLIWLSFGLLAALVLVGVLQRPLRHDLLAAPWVVTMEVGFNGQRTSIRALMDTGNALSDPVSHLPVVLVEYEQLRAMLPPTVEALYHHAEQPSIDELILAAQGTALERRMRVIPYHSVGREKGMLLGFRPDWIVVRDGGAVYEQGEAIIAIHNQLLSPYGTYQGLAHPDLLCV